MRACSGSFLTRTWDGRDAVGKTYQPVVVHYAQRILGKLGFAEFRQSLESSKASRRVLIQIRNASSAGNGRLTNPADVMKLRSLLGGKLSADVDAKDFGSLTMREQLAQVISCDILIGVHGSAMTHVIFMRKGRGVIEVSTEPAPLRSVQTGNTFYGLAGWVGVQYRSLRGRMSGGFMSFDIERVIAFAEELFKLQDKR
mmetsp:Transcript_90971/g.245872  ORF Transcript_90971/g.245872 Transcript_90971/m.245872 type:complete len:199 (+) Transcript_90971:127-723(+)